MLALLCWRCCAGAAVLVQLFCPGTGELPLPAQLSLVVWDEFTAAASGPGGGLAALLRWAVALLLWLAPAAERLAAARPAAEIVRRPHTPQSPTPPRCWVRVALLRCLPCLLRFQIWLSGAPLVLELGFPRSAGRCGNAGSAWLPGYSQEGRQLEMLRADATWSLVLARPAAIGRLRATAAAAEAAITAEALNDVERWLR